MSRSPFRQRPWRRVTLVLAQVSSIKTRREGSSRPDTSSSALARQSTSAPSGCPSAPPPPREPGAQPQPDQSREIEDPPSTVILCMLAFISSQHLDSQTNRVGNPFDSKPNHALDQALSLAPLPSAGGVGRGGGGDVYRTACIRGRVPACYSAALVFFAARSALCLSVISLTACWPAPVNLSWFSATQL